MTTFAVAMPSLTTDQLFYSDPTDQILLSCHLLGKPTAAQLMRLYGGQVSTIQDMRAILCCPSRGCDHQCFMAVGDDISELMFLRGDGKATPLPCCKGLTIK